MVLVERAAWIILVGAAIGVGCRTAELSAGGSQVRISPSAPVDHGYRPTACRSLGYLSGRGGGSFGGAWISNDELVQYAMNDLRNQASKLGANYVQHDSPQLGVAGGKNGTSTTTATVNGTAYFCEGEPTDPVGPGAVASHAPPAAASVPASSVEPPRGAAGFTFGAPHQEAEAACRASGHSWSQQAEVGTCADAPQPVGFPARVAVRACRGKVCEVTVHAGPADRNEHLWRKRYADLKSLLSSKYGAAAEQTAEFPAECRETVLACAEQGRVRFEFRWRWATGESVRYFFGKREAGPVMEVTYGVDPARFDPPPAL
jgi:hypothetical protein